MVAASIPGRSVVRNAGIIQRAHPRFVENLRALAPSWSGSDSLRLSRNSFFIRSCQSRNNCSPRSRTCLKTPLGKRPKNAFVFSRPSMKRALNWIVARASRTRKQNAGCCRGFENNLVAQGTGRSGRYRALHRTFQSARGGEFLPAPHRTCRVVDRVSAKGAHGTGDATRNPARIDPASLSDRLRSSVVRPTH